MTLYNSMLAFLRLLHFTMVRKGYSGLPPQVSLGKPWTLLELGFYGQHGRPFQHPTNSA